MIVERPWRVLSGVFAVYAAFGLLMASSGALVPSIREDLGLSRSQMGVVLGAWQFAYIGASIPCGRLIDRIGLRRALLVCTTIMGGSMLFRSTASGFGSLLLWVGVFGIGAPIVSIAAPKAAAVLFEGAERRRAVGIYGMSPTLGSAIALATANSVVAPLVGDTWQGVTVAFGVIGLLAGGYWWWASATLDGSVPAPAPTASVRQLLAVPVVRAVLVIAMTSFVFVHGIGQWLVDLLSSEGRSVQAAGYWTSAGSLMGMMGTLLIPRVATAGRRVAVLSSLLVFGGVAATALLAATDSWLALPLAVNAVARSATMPIAMLILMDHERVGPDNMAGAGSLFFTAAQVGGVFGPWLTGVLADGDAGFQAALWTHGALMVALAVFVFVVVPRAAGVPRLPRARILAAETVRQPEER